MSEDEGQNWTFSLPPPIFYPHFYNCTKEIKTEAKICLFCGYKFTDRPTTPPFLHQEIGNFREQRILYSDGNCIGVINEKGVCNICGKKSKEEIKSKEDAERSGGR